ncbi:acyloxyacyl hydrolase [Aestuariivivens insulae]|uniref:acyloxyacyl hydrolase n=1 Tax=Aestuariivivens insulae TaxID=1621988 RepID=UPI001F59FA0F|nr:acyloxyacyl hydrolase [Aestuariivivens insulae]
MSNKRRFGYEINIEPSVYFSRHQLLNKYYIQPNTGSNYLELREQFTQKRSFEEYAINFGIILRYKLLTHFSTYLLGSVGPMIATQGTERLKKGFAFSDILGYGFSYQQKRLLFDLRLTIRHNSNFELASPNEGHNSIGIESGISFQIK